MQYPEGTRFGSYFVAKEGHQFAIKRMVYLPTGKRSSIRLSKDKFSHCKSKEDLDRFVVRLNGRENRRTIQLIETKLAFLPPALMEEFRDLLLAEIPSQDFARNYYHNLHRYFLKFFVDTLDLKDPIEWKSHESKWGSALLNESKHGLYEDSEPRSVRTIRAVIQVANRFMEFLHHRTPQEIPFIKFKPISKAKFRDYDARLRLNEEPIGYYIPDGHWELIVGKLPDSIAPFIKLAYYYGLRRAETLGIQLTNIRKGYLNVERQLETCVRPKKKGPIECTFKPLKNKNGRQTPHWFLEPKVAYELIKATEGKLMHPDTLGSAFTTLVDELSLPYAMHDLRRTFITKALRLHNPVDVQLAVGHSDIRTTMRYQQDDRSLDDDLFLP